MNRSNPNPNNPLINLGRKLPLCGLALLAGLVLATPAQAQYIRFRAPNVRVTVPLNTTTSTLITNRVLLNGIGAGGATLDVTGLPSGASATLSAYNVTDSAQVDMTVNAVNVPQGVHTFSLNGSGLDTNGVPVTNNIFFTLQAGYIWNGSTNVAADGPGNWSDSSKWLGGGVPGAGDDVVFTSASGQTNTVIGNTTATNLTPNIIINDDLTVGSLRFSTTNSVNKAHTIKIADGKTLAITGTNGFMMLRDYVSEFAGIPQQTPANVAVMGTNSTLLITNDVANFAILTDFGYQGSTFSPANMNSVDLTGLSNFRLYVHRIGLGDYQLYPNFNNLSTANAYNGVPSKFSALLNLAATNVIRATYVDTNNFTNSERRDYSLTLGNNERSGTSSNPQYTINFGIVNQFFLDSICFGHAALSMGAQFHPFYATNYACTATFRGTNGGRMSMWAQGDLGQGTLGMASGSNAKGTANFSAGTVDILVDRMHLAMDRPNPGTGCNAQTTLQIAAGNVDANTVILGYQKEIGKTNLCYSQGTLTLNGTVFRVNNSLILGYTSEDPTNNTLTQTYSSFGRANINSNATLMANTVLVGGATKLSGNNVIAISTGGNLIVSNTIAGPDQYLTTLSVAGNNSALTLHLDGNHSGCYVYTTNLTATGTGSKLVIASVNNLSYPAYVPLVQYVSSVGAGVFDAGVEMPAGSGLHGTLWTSSSNTVDLEIISRAPNTLVWRGAGSTADWNYTTKSWLDVNTGLMTNYDNPDIVIFDGTPGYANNINLAGTLPFTPSSITMTNNSFQYTILSGGNQIAGGPVLSKYGTGTLQIDGNTSVSVQLNQGALTGSGSIGNASITAGTLMNFSGSLSGSLLCAGTALSSGTIAGNLAVYSGGVVTNYGTVNNAISFQTNSLLYNAASGSLINIGSPTVSSNATFINAGTITGTSLGVSGTFIDLATTLGFNVSLTVNSGGMFLPGGNGIGTTTVMEYPQFAAHPAGRAQLATGSRTLFKVDVANGNTKLLTRSQTFGPSQGTKGFTGCTLVITNIGATPFAAGQTFKLFGNYYTDGDIIDAGLNTTNSYPIMDPPAPGAGLAWDLKQLIPQGYVGVIAAPTATPTMIADISNVTTISTNIPPVTNNYVVFHMTWPDDYTNGWKLQQLNTTLDKGASDTNWVTIFNSTYVSDITISNSLSGGGSPAVFYRLAYP